MATIQGVYVALFGRPADPAGLAYFNGITNNGADLAKIGVLSGQKEYTTRFEGKNNVAIINTIYQSLFGRDAEAAGLEFFSNALTKGTLSINNIAIAILDGAQGDDKTTVANKLTAADNFTKAIDTSIEVNSYVGTSAADAGRTYLSTVTKDTTSIPTTSATDTALADIVAKGQAGATLTVVDADAVSLTATDAKYKTTAQNDTVTVTDTYAAAGSIDGGLGTDTVVLKDLAAAIVPAAGKLVSVEKLVITSSNDAASLDVTNVGGLKEVWNDGSAGFKLAVIGLQAGQTVGVKGSITDTTTFTLADATGGSDKVVLGADGATVTAAVTIAGVETVEVAVKSASTIADLQATGAKNITITGAGDLTLDATGAAKASIDGSAHTGKFVLTGVADDYTVKGGTGNDTFTTDAAATGGVKLTGGAGADLFKITAESNLVDISTDAKVLADVNQILDFTGAEDTLQFVGIGGAANKATLTNTQVSDIAAATTLSAALTVAGAATAALAADGWVSFAWKGSTYVYHDNGHDGFNANDGVVQLVGFTGDLTATNFVSA